MAESVMSHEDARAHATRMRKTLDAFKLAEEVLQAAVSAKDEASAIREENRRLEEGFERKKAEVEEKMRGFDLAEAKREEVFAGRGRTLETRLGDAQAELERVNSVINESKKWAEDQWAQARREHENRLGELRREQAAEVSSLKGEVGALAAEKAAAEAELEVIRRERDGMLSRLSKALK